MDFIIAAGRPLVNGRTTTAVRFREATMALEISMNVTCTYMLSNISVKVCGLTNDFK